MMFGKIDSNQTTWHKVKWHNYRYYRYSTGEMARVVINFANGKLTKCSTFSILGFGFEAGSIYKGEFKNFGLEKWRLL